MDDELDPTYLNKRKRRRRDARGDRSDAAERQLRENARTLARYRHDAKTTGWMARLLKADGVAIAAAGAFGVFFILVFVVLFV